MNLRVICACLFLAPLGLMAIPPRQADQATRQASPRGSSTGQPDAGERVFVTNCSRCHAAPMSFPPRITGTVIMHMRTRARLSQNDERLLLKFLAP
jgi:cytochrome c5